MIVDEETYHDLVDADAGYCRKCNQVTEESNIEPDARGYLCPQCGNHTVYGVEEALVMGLIQVEV